MTFQITRPEWLPRDKACWGQHGDTAQCYCGKAVAKWLRRGAAHASGRHARPQVDCWACWQAGHFTEPPPDTSGLWHTGQHDSCAACDVFVASEAPRHDHGVAELCGPDCSRYWWRQEREGRL